MIFSYGLTAYSLNNLSSCLIIRLAAGDMVPADVRVLFAKDLFLNQAALTGLECHSVSYHQYFSIASLLVCGVGKKGSTQPLTD